MFGMANDTETIPVSGDPGGLTKWRRKEDSRRPGSVTPNSCDFWWVFFYLFTQKILKYLQMCKIVSKHSHIKVVPIKSQVEH